MKFNVLVAITLIVPGAATAQKAAPALARSQVEAQIKTNFGRMDTNRDGFVSRAESAEMRDTAINARMNAMFDALDSDRSGTITRAEFMAAQKRAMASATKGKQLPDREFDAADANRDGRVSLAEVLAGPLRQFDAADANRDGMLNAAERQAASNRQRQRR